MSIVFFDFETGGIVPSAPEIQLAAVAVSPAWDELDSLELKIQFDEAKCDPEALKINHYDPESWKSSAIPEVQAVRAFCDFLRKHSSIEMKSRAGNSYKVARLAGHNAATFDGPRLKAMFERHHQFLPAHPQVLCTLQRAMWFFAETGLRIDSLKLGSICKYFNIELSDAHDALADVRGSIAIARAMSERKEVAA